VILRRDARLPIVAVNLWYHVGAARETQGRSGFAHLFEHMMFQGSGHIEEGSYFRHLEGVGASFVNGTTDFDRTNYMEDVPSNQLELALWLESDRMGFLLDRLDQRMLSNQQDVVRNERRQSIEGAPYGLAQERIYHLLFDEAHPYHGMVMGSHRDIQAARLEDVRDFFRRYYAPNNASLAIVGDIDVAKTPSLVEKYFGGLPRGPELPPTQVATPTLDRERRALVTDQVELPRVYLAWLAPRAFQPGDAEAEVVAEILGGGKASRLYRSLIYETKIAQSIGAEHQPLTLASVFQISATAKPGHDAAELEAAIDRQLSMLAERGPTEQELDAAKISMRARIVMSLEHVGGFGGVADRLNYYNQYCGDPDWLERDLARYDAVTVAGVRDLVAKTLRRDARVVVHAVPGEKEIPEEPGTPPAPSVEASSVEPADPWRHHPPVPTRLEPRSLPRATTFRLANGLAVYLLRLDALPVVVSRLVVRSGSESDPTAMPGLAGFTAAMIDEGTAKRDAMAIARDLESLGADLGISTGTDGSSVTLHCLKETVDRAMEIVSDVVLSPTFPVDELERIRTERLTALLQQRDSPFQIGSKTMIAALYGADHPYGHVALGSDAGLRRIMRDDLVGFYSRAFTPANAALILTGDLTEAEARRLAEDSFGAWSGARTEARTLPSASSAPERVLIVDKPGAPQTYLMIGQVCVPRSDPDFERLDAMNQVLGGLFTSRINLNLREKHGYTYGARSAIGERRGPGPFYVAASVRTDATGDSIRQSMSEIEGMLSQPVRDDELSLARESLARSLPAFFESTWTTAATVGDLYLFDLPSDYFERLPERIDAMTAPEVFEATRRHLSPDRMIVIAVGDRAAIEPQIQSLGLGPIGFVGVNGSLD
jgi:zinc protease